ncbi:MAG: Nif3-like dinuclear metal center hexameric protein [Planctomycetes bacterium]|nr:Nif3-like dinuclear metal center hexameric protein [Planctomycetota bacterium]
MTIQTLVEAMQRIAPPEYAENWDKVGLLAGDRSRPITGPILVTIDFTEAVLAEAIALKASAVIAYHPPIWEPLTRITDATPRQRFILRALEAGMAIYSPHTALDAVQGGVTDWLAEGLSGSTEAGKIAGDCRALTPHAHLPSTQQVKIVTFVPTEAEEQVRGALATAGAGIIGGYQLCSFSSSGTGTFMGGEGTKPTVGQPGRVEHVSEHRLEMVCSKQGLALAIETLRRFHPYEEPAIDVYDLAAQPRRTIGSGRRLVLDKPVTMAELAQRLKGWIHRDRVRFALATPTDVPVKFIGVVPGAGASLSKLARSEGCEVFVTGEMSHHDVMGALHAGMNVLLGNHTSTERGFLPRLAQRLSVAMPGATVLVSKADKDPLVTV